MLFYWRWYRADQILSRVGLAKPLLDAIAEDPADLAAHPMGRKAGATAVDALQDSKDLRRVNISDRSFRQPRKHIILEAGRRLFVPTYLHNSLSLFHPAFRDDCE